MIRNIPQFLIAAPTSGTGKTTVSRLLMTLLTQKKLRVQPYKCGPDYIDTKYHEKACGIPSYNLDPFMASEQHMHEVYVSHAKDADVCIVEGMMGMFDGYDRSKGSSAEIAKILNLPVVLVVNAKSAAYSLAAMIKGYLDFDPQVEIAGIIFNQAGSDRHEEMLREICDDLNVPCLGCLRKFDALKEESRHLGLDFSRKDEDGITETLLKQLDAQLNLDLLLQITRREVDVITEVKKNVSLSGNIWVARNKESFSFIYAEHLDYLNQFGTVTFFDPEDNSAVVPDNVDLLYLPGGYPEDRALQLSAAPRVIGSVKAHIERGGKTIAECGGMMYLASELVMCKDPYTAFKMVDALPMKVSACKDDMRLAMGYRSFDFRGVKLRGHEFHYSRIIAQGEKLASAVQVYNAKGHPVNTAVFCYKNLIASYTHLYWGETGIWSLFEQVPGE
jgi:cobyrinic acid a,c-diamide synthase